MAIDNTLSRKSISRFGAILSPPTLVLEIVKDGQAFVKKIRIRNVETTTCEHICLKLQSLYPEYVNSKIIDPMQLQSIIDKLISASAAESKTKALLPQLKPAGTMVFKPMQVNQLSEKNIAELDLNTCSDELNAKAKQLMSVDFEAKRLKPGDEGYEYDKQVEFEAPTEATEWDDEDD